MPSSFSSLLRLELMQTGEKTNTWGDITNTNLGTLLEKAIAGTTSVSVSASDVTLTAQNGADDQSRSAIILVTGTPGVSRNVVAPSSSKIYVVSNGSNAAIVFKGGATTGVTMVAGERALLAWTGSDFVRVGPALNSPTFTGNALFDNITASGNVAFGDSVTDTFALSGSTVKNASGQWLWAAPTSGAHEIRGLAAANALRVTDGTNYAIHLKQKGGSMGFVGAEAGFLFSVGANDTSMLTFTTAGNAALAAPSSGNTMEVAGLSGAIALRAQTTGDSIVTSQSNTSGDAYLKAVTNGVFTHSFRSTRSTAALDIMQDSAVMASFNSSRALTLNAPASGSHTFNGLSGAARLAVWNGSYHEYQLASVTYGYIGDRAGVMGSGSGMAIRSDTGLYFSAGGGTEQMALAGSGAVNLSVAGATLNFTNTGSTLAQINSYNSNALELVTRNAAAVVKMYSGNAVPALTLSTTQAVFGHSLHNNSVVPTGTTNQPPGMSGTSNPSITSITNLTGTPTSGAESWTRTANKVTVTGVLTGVVVTSPGSAATVQLTVPITMAFGFPANCFTGKAWDSGTTSGMGGTAISTTQVQLGWLTSTAGSHSIYYEYSYLAG